MSIVQALEGCFFKWLARSKLTIVQIVQRLAKTVLFSLHIEARPLVFEVLSVADNVRVVPGDVVSLGLG